jgi:hypothetical protein
MKIFRVNSHVALAVEVIAKRDELRDLWRYRVMIDGHVVVAGASLTTPPDTETDEVAVCLVEFMSHHVDHYECSHVRYSADPGQCHEGSTCILHDIAAEQIERIAQYIEDLTQWADERNGPASDDDETGRSCH